MIYSLKNLSDSHSWEWSHFFALFSWPNNSCIIFRNPPSTLAMFYIAHICFCVFAVQLLHKLSIHAADGPQKLLKVCSARCVSQELIISRFDVPFCSLVFSHLYYTNVQLVFVVYMSHKKLCVKLSGENWPMHKFINVFVAHRPEACCLNKLTYDLSCIQPLF